MKIYIILENNTSSQIKYTERVLVTETEKKKCSENQINLNFHIEIDSLICK